ncbi:putative MFS sugar transporter [Aspergillus granulosus]|uniref:MFS sugar transporter n=1 Tax=Aspergillus granulosus TaxID=176169 RepID=A0ABR4H459_9EURO
MADPKIEAIEHIESSHGGPKVTTEGLDEFLRAEKEMTTWQAIKTHKRVLFFAILPFVCAMNYGYDTISNGSSIAMPAFILSFGSMDATGSMYLPSIWTSLWTSMTNLGQAFGAFAAGILSQQIGRRWTAIALAVLSIAGTFILFFATSRGMLLVGKIINGAVVGGLMAVGTTYAADISTIRMRGAVLQALVFFGVIMQGVSLGMVRAFVPNSKPIAWKVVFGIQWVFACLAIVAALVVPESPVYLLSKNKTTQAEHALRRIYGKSDPNLSLRLQSLTHTLEEERRHDAGSISIMELFRGHNLKRTLTISFFMFSTSAIGIPFMSQNIYFLFTVGLPAVHVFDIGIGGFFLGGVFVLLGWVSNDKIGRRRLWLCGLVGNFIGMAIVGGLAYSGTMGSIWAIGIIMNLLISYTAYSLVGVAWTICPEISSHRLRHYSQSFAFLIGAISGWLFNFVTPYMYNVDSGNLGAKTGFVYAGLTLIVGAISWFLVPETAGLSMEDIDLAYETGMAPREFYKMRI